MQSKHGCAVCEYNGMQKDSPQKNSKSLRRSQFLSAQKVQQIFPSTIPNPSLNLVTYLADEGAGLSDELALWLQASFTI
ncbi:hypothetical protein L2E82_21133 [Cichorium intybus]|uniref:Uncharacterized protein n=1 Tax=Cichorium intybus TaxID=13427 RepID=A0ACB9DUZ0_CICIN|nr:hypothetical protein L2E82_21133 [Cichorium intybus]